MSAAVKQILQHHKASMEALGIYDPHGLVFAHPEVTEAFTTISSADAGNNLYNVAGSNIDDFMLSDTHSFPMLWRWATLPQI